MTADFILNYNRSVSSIDCFSYTTIHYIIILMEEPNLNKFIKLFMKNELVSQLLEIFHID